MDKNNEMGWRVRQAYNQWLIVFSIKSLFKSPLKSKEIYA